MSGLTRFILMILAAAVILVVFATGVHLRSRRRDDKPVLGNI